MATGGCPQRAAAQRAAPDQGRGFVPFPGAFALIPQLSSLYLVNVGGPRPVLSVINPSRCTATNTSGCRIDAPSVPEPEFLLAIDPATNTIYGGNQNLPQIDVINAATCNATNTTGCGQAPGVVTVGNFTFNLAVSVRTDTIYAPSVSDNTVAVINGATCNGANHSGCGHLADTARAGMVPFAAAVNDRTRTVYVTNLANGDSPGTVSVINGATCNGTHTSGCHQRFPVLPTGRGPLGVAVDPSTGTVYVSNLFSATATILNGSRQSGRQQAIGSLPQFPAVNPRTHTVYVTQAFQAGSMSIFSTTGH